MIIKYRPEIDGLRAIAVGAVILYHAQITIFGYQPFKGGFIGVDIFFVISGYLITSIILKELLTTGSFSFKHFYERRIRRILPALLFVMLVSLPFAWMYLLPSSFVDFSKSILYSLGFSSNFYFHYSGQQYGAESGLLIPFLHTWSLSVEEQYYILFPIVLLITFRYLRNYLNHILIFGFVISLGLAEWTSRNHLSVSFYFLHTRMWELLAGSLLAYIEIILGYRSKQHTLNLILPSVGLFLVGHSIIFFDDEMIHPSFFTLSPIIGACLIILFSNKDELITKILSTKFFTGIGLISYSLYLWHYPIFAFDRLIDFTQGSLLNQFLLIIFIILLSIFSYHFIEKNFRSKNNNSKMIFGSIIISIFFLIIFNFNVTQKEGFYSRVPGIPKDNLESKAMSKICAAGRVCKFNIFSNKKIYIIGDSHMGRLIYDLKKKVVEKDYQFIAKIFGGCLYFPGFDYIIPKNRKKKECNNEYFQDIKKNLLNEENNIIIFGGRFPVHLSNQRFKLFDNQEGGIEGKNVIFKEKYISLGTYNSLQESFKNEITKLHNNNNKIILIYPIPEVGWDVLQIMMKNIKENGDAKNFSDFKNINTSYDVYKNRTKSSFELLDSIKGENIYRVYPHTLFCDTNIKNRCVTHDNKNIFYIDDNHLSLEGAKMVNDLIIKEIEKIELKSN
jgi:peptidoglycan/LPS O-acetylase OafA/YrhL